MGVATLKTSRLADALVAYGPNPEHADALMLFGQFVGEWDFPADQPRAADVRRAALGR